MTKIYLDRTRNSNLAEYLFFHPEECPPCFKPISSSLFDCHFTEYGNAPDENFVVCDECVKIVKQIRYTRLGVPGDFGWATRTPAPTSAPTQNEANVSDNGM